MDEWNIGDICFIIANKAKGYVYPYKILSISEKGYYHIQSEITGMRHNVSPSRMFHSKEEALQSLGFPAHAEQKIVDKNSFDTESDDRQSPVEAVEGIGALLCDRENDYSRNIDPDGGT